MGAQLLNVTILLVVHEMLPQSTGKTVGQPQWAPLPEMQQQIIHCVQHK